MLCKTTVVVWSEFEFDTIEQLGYEADRGEAYCCFTSVDYVDDPLKDPQFTDGAAEFFNVIPEVCHE